MFWAKELGGTFAKRHQLRAGLSPAFSPSQMPPKSLKCARARSPDPPDVPATSRQLPDNVPATSRQRPGSVLATSPQCSGSVPEAYRQRLGSVPAALQHIPGASQQRLGGYKRSAKTTHPHIFIFGQNCCRIGLVRFRLERLQKLTFYNQIDEEN